MSGKLKAKDCRGKPFNFDWKNSKFKCLGIWIGNFFVFTVFYFSLFQKIYKLILFKLNRIHYRKYQDSNFIKVILIYNFKVITILIEKESKKKSCF